MQVCNIIQMLEYLQASIHHRLQNFFNKENNEAFTYPEINLKGNDSSLGRFLLERRLSVEEYIILLLALAPHILPGFFENIIQQYLPQGGDFPEFGGVKGTNYRGMLPTGETALFILAGNDVETRIRIQGLLVSDSVLVKEQILSLEKVPQEPLMSGKIMLSDEYAELFLTGKMPKIKSGPDFPAKLVTTQMEWKDLILSKATSQHIENIRLWLQYHEILSQQNNISKRIKPGYKALFYGPSGTGKTLTAALLGNEFSMDVYRIDLAQVVSKYIGETEKNLEKVFSIAEHKNWILFFDEADALFSRRGQAQSANDRYANQETAYLLQRVEDYPGLIVLASNYKNNMDNAFLRRFNAIIHFPVPGLEERICLWKNALPDNFSYDFNIKQIAAAYELSGAAIVNVIHYALLRSFAVQRNIISGDDIMQGIKYEFQKEDKFIG